MSDAASNLIKTCDGGYIITASSSSGKFGDKSEGGYGGRDIWIIRLDRDWNILWDKTIGGIVTESSPLLFKINKREYFLVFSSQSPHSGNLSQENPDYKISPYVIKITDKSIPKNWFQAWRKGCSICESIDEFIEMENLLNQVTEISELFPE
ncbi:MAG: hypothetical protein IPM48_07035 [Saprospiraceae bacterium]|nr:hypothetical protein [Saprospiraceae bacterium]